MRPVSFSALALVAALGGACGSTALAETVGDAAINRSTLDVDPGLRIIVDQAFSAPGESVGSYTLYAGAVGSITPYLYSGVDDGNDTTFTVTGVGQTQSITSLGLQTFAFNLASGANLTGANTFFGFYDPGAGVIPFDFRTSGAPAYIDQPSSPDALGDTFTLSDGHSQNGIGGIDDRNYSINATATGPAVSAAPEPAIWTLMLAGLGGMGLRLRRTRRDARSGAVAMA